MSHSKYVLCILLEKQIKEYEKEFAQLRLSNADFVFESSPEKALALINKNEPHLVIIGMDVGQVEGIELLAMVLKRYPKFSKTIVLLPDKADGLPPVAHSRDPETGNSTVENVEIDYIAKLITQPPSGTSSKVKPTPNQVKRFRLIVLAAGGGLVLVLVIALCFFLIPAKEEDKKIVPLIPQEASNHQAVINTVAENSTSSEQATQSESTNATEFVLPLSFKHGQGIPTITDEAKLSTIVEEVKKQPHSQIEVTGHTSRLGSPELNYEVGMVRAKMAMKILVDRGISRYRFVLKSVGETVPVASNASSKGQDLNRRVTIRLLPPEK